MWRPYQVAWCINHWDEIDTREMLHTDFWIKELKAKDWSWNILKVIEWNGYVISFFETSVQLKSFEANNKWEIVEKTKTIFRNNIEVKWKWTTTIYKDVRMRFWKTNIYLHGKLRRKNYTTDTK